MQGDDFRARPEERLSPDEDQAMRRLHWFETLGCELSSAVQTVKDNLRRRDRRAEIREPGATYDKAAEDAHTKDTENYWAR
ncbi:MAG: hypothetical protein ACJ735_05580 [Actinomycetes bacterium]